MSSSHISNPGTTQIDSEHQHTIAFDDGPELELMVPMSDLDLDRYKKVKQESSHTVTEDHLDPNSEDIRKVRWKVDKRLIPMLSLLYLCSYLDRSNIGNTKVANLEEDLNLRPGVYNMALSIFFVGYIVGEIPANIMLKKMGPRKWITIVMLCWGSVSMSMAAVTNGAGLLVTRFFLGLAESGYAPGPVYIISLWYRRTEQALRVGIFFSAATIAGAFGGLVAYAIAHLHGLGGLRAWQWIFILEGLPTIIMALVTFFVLPNFPDTADFLTKEEKELNMQRLLIDAGPATETAFSWKEVWSVFKDWKVYLHTATNFLHSIAFSSLGLFIPSIIRGFDYDPIMTQIMTAPVYIIACIVTITMAFSSDRFSERGYHAAASEALATLGYFLLIMTRDSTTAAKYVSLVFCAAGVYSYIPIQLSWPSSNVGGHTKKGVAIAFVISFAQIGSIFGGQLYRADDAPKYTRGHTICCALLGINTLGNLAIKMLLRRENRRRDQLTTEQYNQECATGGHTDKHPGFRYFE
ncbi:hypothetical protein BG006_004324 [Podila minutissima]|uniref:Major facilitator superfamily (MFS) profile domain-containing protein n=1 Tax=Podila minutissima TaxID=64525 RepID=A0A9P5SLH1_9FUNG|nr:hypothetical protein BG006_004324 [Podila minutissima]